MTYSGEAFVKKSVFYKLETVQNNALSGPVKTTPTLALQLYTLNIPTGLEIQQHATITYTKLR